MSDEDYWLSHVDWVPLQPDGDVVNCITVYMGIYENCPEEATHIQIMDMKKGSGPDYETKGRLRLPRCDDCGEPDRVDWDSSPVTPKRGTA